MINDILKVVGGAAAGYGISKLTTPKEKKSSTSSKKTTSKKRKPTAKKKPTRKRTTYPKGVTAAMARRAKKEGGITIKESKKGQSGRSDKNTDSRAKAKTPGKRLSRNLKFYNETRKNRSDKKGSRV